MSDVPSPGSAAPANDGTADHAPTATGASASADDATGAIDEARADIPAATDTSSLPPGIPPPPITLEDAPLVVPPPPVSPPARTEKAAGLKKAARVAVPLALAVGGFGVRTALRSDSTPKRSWFDNAVPGQCIDLPLGQVRELHEVSCAGPHVAEVFFKGAAGVAYDGTGMLGNALGDPNTRQDPFGDDAVKQCLDQFTPPQVELLKSVFTPLDRVQYIASLGEREFVCYVVVQERSTSLYAEAKSK